jgi:DNA-binding transcriptional MerR regulator
MGAERLRIGQVAELTGTTTRTIRYYEEIGLLPSEGGRERGAHRTYGAADVERLRELLQMKDLLGVTLEELRELATAESSRSALRREWRTEELSDARRAAILEQALGHIADQLVVVRNRRAELERFETELVARRRKLRRMARELAGSEGAPA